ncbi:MAG: response regulator [Magnetococcales bacterium]|nr:response regulator [Magnetococcales bacterium]
MMSSLPFEQRFQRLRSLFLEKLPAKLASMDRWIDDLSDTDTPLPVLNALYLQLHGLVGTAATFDFAPLSDQSRNIAAALGGLLESKREPTSEAVADLLALLEAFRRQAKAFVNDQAAVGPDSILITPATNYPLEKQAVVYSKDTQFLNRLQGELKDRGFSMKQVDSLTELRSLLRQGQPGGVVLDMDDILDSVDEPVAVPGQSLFLDPVPVVAISSDEDVDSRLRAARLGSTHFLAKPINLFEIVKYMSPWRRRRMGKPYRILVVDDDEILTELYDLILDEAGLQVETLNQPMLLLEKLEVFQPELLVLDLHMGECNGIELAKVIRQYRRFANLPILFLSASQNLGWKLSDNNLFHEDHLIKPVRPSVLVQAVIKRVKRTRSKDRVNDHLRSVLRELENTQFAMNRHAIVSITDVDGRITYVNDKFCTISGFQQNELIGQNHSLVKSDYHPVSFYEGMWRTITQGKVWHGQVKNKHKNGQPYWVAATIIPFLDARGKPYEYVSIRTDITQQKDAEDKTRSMALFAEMNPAPVLRINSDGCVLEANPAAATVLGVKPGQMDRLADLIDGADDIDIASCIATNDQIIISPRIGDRYYHISIQGVADLQVGHVYGTDITEQKLAEVEMRLAKEAAEKANRAKSEFLSGMSHELRTPMNAVLGFSQLLESDPVEPLTEGQLDSVKEIIKAGQHLLELINEVLDLAKVESGKLQLDLEAVALRDVMDESFTLIKTLAQERNITIVPHRQCDEFVVQADRTRLKQILLNLLSNAIKYNQNGGKISFLCESMGEQRLRIGISDTGIGIGPDELKTVFEPFNRLGAEHSGVEGTGIGLVITKRLVEHMGGSVSVESAVGKGTTFWVELEVLARIVDEQADTEVSQSVDVNNYSKQKQSYTLLHVEDTPANLKLIEHMVRRRSDIRLISALDGELGLQLARSEKPDMILLDINLPGMNGYEVLKVLKSQSETAHIPVMAVSANAMQEDVEAGIDAGFVHYLVKPVQFIDFIESIDSVIDLLKQEVS